MTTDRGEVERDRVMRENGKLNCHIDDLEAERDRLRKALQFYAFSDWNDNYPGGICYEHNGETYLDTGEVAQQALEETT